MTDYSLKIVPVSKAPIKNVKDTNPPSKIHMNLPKNSRAAKVVQDENYARRPISNHVNSCGIDEYTRYNGYNDLVNKIDNSKTVVKRENGVCGIGCTKRTITYFDKDNNEIAIRKIDEDKKIDQLSFRGNNGNWTILWDNNHNGNFEYMEQYATWSRTYTWCDNSDNKHGVYDAVKMESQPGQLGARYDRTYDFNKERIVDDLKSNPQKIYPETVLPNKNPRFF